MRTWNATLIFNCYTALGCILISLNGKQQTMWHLQKKTTAVLFSGGFFFKLIEIHWSCSIQCWISICCHKYPKNLISYILTLGLHFIGILHLLILRILFKQHTWQPTISFYYLVPLFMFPISINRIAWFQNCDFHLFLKQSKYL